MNLNEIDLKALDNIIKLMTKNQVETLEIEGLKITKRIHLGKPVPQSKKQEPAILHTYTEEEIMFASSGAPQRSLEDFDRYAVNAPKES